MTYSFNNMVYLVIYILKLAFGVFTRSHGIQKYIYISVLWPRRLILNFKVRRHSHKILRYILPYQSECVASCLNLNFKVKGQGRNHATYLFEFPDIHLVIMDTKYKFLWHILTEISYWMLYFMFDLEFQGQRSRSQRWTTEISHWMRYVRFTLEYQDRRSR